MTADGQAVWINDVEVPVDQVPVNWTLADLIRRGTRFHGTHVGCEHGVCGVCTVLLDGQPVRSCLVLSHAACGRRVTTVEGLAMIDADLAARIRGAFLSRNGFQCGFCTPGMQALVFAAAQDNGGTCGDLADGQDPSAPALRARQVVDANICRCTGYSAIVAAAADVLGGADANGTAETAADQ
jgi:carbon-monoxide dehydrogenase small subunit